MAMEIITLNIRHGAGPRAQALLDWIGTQSADVIVLAEWRENAPGKFIQEALTKSGFYVTTVSRSGSNGVLLAAKDDCQARRITPADAASGELLLADVSGCNLLAAYFPQRKAKISFFNICAHEAQRSESMPSLLLGDINTGRNDVDVEGTGTPFDCADLFCALETRSGLLDLWRSEHGDRREWSWGSRIYGFRVDHALANEAFQKRFSTIRCRYDHGPRESGLTDHSALLVKCTR